MPIRVGIAFHADFPAGAFNPHWSSGTAKDDVTRAGADPSVACGDLLDFDAAASCRGNDFARYMCSSDIAAAGFSVEAIDRVNLQISRP